MSFQVKVNVAIDLRSILPIIAIVSRDNNLELSLRPTHQE